MLYRESEIKEKELKIRQKERELELLKLEVAECTFTPQPFQGRSRDKKEVRGRTLKFGQLGSDDNDSNRIRSPDKFYSDMVEFKKNKEMKLEKMRHDETMNL